MIATFGGLTVIPFILLAQVSWDVTPGEPEVHLAGALHDHGGVFSRVAKVRAHGILDRIQRDHRIPVVVETFETLRGAPIDEVARHRPRTLGDEGLYILIAGRERDVFVGSVGVDSAAWPTEKDLAAIREAILVPLRTGDADWALDQGLRAVDASITSAGASRPRVDRSTIVPLASLLALLAILVAICPGEVGPKPRAEAETQPEPEPATRERLHGRIHSPHQRLL